MIPFLCIWATALLRPFIPYSPRISRRLRAFIRNHGPLFFKQILFGTGGARLTRVVILILVAPDHLFLSSRITGAVNFRRAAVYVQRFRFRTRCRELVAVHVVSLAGRLIIHFKVFPNRRPPLILPPCFSVILFNENFPSSVLPSVVFLDNTTVLNSAGLVPFSSTKPCVPIFVQKFTVLPYAEEVGSTASNLLNVPTGLDSTVINFMLSA